MSDCLQPPFSPEEGVALVEMTSYMNHPAYVEPEHSVDLDLSSDVDPYQRARLDSGVDANNIVVDDPIVLDKTVDEAVGFSTEPSAKGILLAAGGSVAASEDRPAEAEKAEDVNVQAELTNSLQTDLQIKEDIHKKSATEEEQGTRANPQGLRAEDPDLYSNVDPIQSNCMESSLDANNFVFGCTALGENIDETSEVSTEPRAKGKLQSAGESVTASEKPAEAEKIEDINEQAGLTNGHQTDHHITEDIKKSRKGGKLIPKKEENEKEQVTKAEPRALYADEVLLNKEAKRSPKKVLANVDLNAEPETNQIPLSSNTTGKPSKILAHECMAKENHSSGSAESTSVDFQPASKKQAASAVQEPPRIKMLVSPDRLKKEKLTEPKKAQVSKTSKPQTSKPQTSKPQTSKCNRQDSNRKVEGQLKKKVTVKQTKNGSTSDMGHQLSSRATPELQKTNPLKIKTKRSPNHQEVSRDKAAGDYSALAWRQGRKKPPSPGEQDLLSDIIQVVRASSRSPSDEAEDLERSPPGGLQREKAAESMVGFFEGTFGRRTFREGLVPGRGESKPRSAEPPSSPLLHHSALSPLAGEDVGSLTFQAERKKTRKARNLKLWQFLKRWTVLDNLAATSDLDRYHSNSLDLLYSLVEFSSNLGLAALEIVVGQSAVDRLDSVVTSGLTALLNKTASLKDTHLHRRVFLLMSGFCQSLAGKSVIAVTTLAAETAGKALSAVNRSYDCLGLEKKRTEDVRQEGLIKLCLRACCFPVWAYVYFWATILSMLNSTLLSYRDSAARRTGSRRRKSGRGGTERDHSLFSPNPARNVRLSGYWKKKRSRSDEEEGEEMTVDHGFDEANRMTIVVRSDVRQVKVTPRPNGGRPEEISTAPSRNVPAKEIELREAEEYEEHSDEEDEEDKTREGQEEQGEEDEEEKEEDEEEEILEAKRRRVAAIESVSPAPREPYPFDIHVTLSPSDGKERWQFDKRVTSRDVTGQAKEGRRITPVRRRLRGGMRGAPFHLLGIPPACNEAAKFEDLSVGEQFLCILKKLPGLSSILRDPRDQSQLAYLHDVSSLITDNHTRLLVQTAPKTRRDERDLKRKLPEDTDTTESEDDN